MRARRTLPGERTAPASAVFDEDTWYPPADVMQRLSLSRKTVDRLVADGLVRGMRIRGSVRLLGADLNGLMEPIGPPKVAG